MARKKVVNETKNAIIRVAIEMFLERGFTNTSVRAIAAELGISTGNITFYFPSKEHLLMVLVEMLCDSQWSMLEQQADEEETALMAFRPPCSAPRISSCARRWPLSCPDAPRRQAHTP
mgnify:CR=1 FL=1